VDKRYDQPGGKGEGGVRSIVFPYIAYEEKSDKALSLDSDLGKEREGGKRRDWVKRLFLPDRKRRRRRKILYPIPKTQGALVLSAAWDEGKNKGEKGVEGNTWSILP